MTKRVYCSGVFDMCHLGHMLLFERAAKLGTLIVGVHNDKDVESFKRTPIVNHNERCQTVSLCKNVDEIIPNAPLYLDEKFLKEHNIDIVVCSDEYDTPEDLYYKIPRELNILVVLPRTSGISTTKIIENIMNR